jgi:hypothetical protein
MGIANMRDIPLVIGRAEHQAQNTPDAGKR